MDLSGLGVDKEIARMEGGGGTGCETSVDELLLTHEVMHEMTGQVIDDNDLVNSKLRRSTNNKNRHNNRLSPHNINNNHNNNMYMMN